MAEKIHGVIASKLSNKNVREWSGVWRKGNVQWCLWGLSWPESTFHHVGLGQASPSLEAPRLQVLETRDLFHQENRKGKIVMTKTSRYKGLVLGSFWVREFNIIFGDGVGGLPCSRPLLPTRCWFDAFLHWNSADEEARLARKTYWHKDKARLTETRNYIIV